MQRQPLHENAFVFCNGPLLTAFGRTLLRGSEITFALCNSPPSHFVRPDPRVWTTRPPEGVCYQALSWLLWFAFRAKVVQGSKKRTQTWVGAT